MIDIGNWQEIQTLVTPLASILFILGIPGFYFWIEPPKKYFKVKFPYTYIGWKNIASIPPETLLDSRPVKTYHPIIDKNDSNNILDQIEKGNNVLIKGKPLSGKTRMVYEIFQQINNPLDILILKNTDINRDDFSFYRHLFFWRRKYIIIDNLHQFVEKKNFEYVLYEARNKGIPIIATTQTGVEFKKIIHKFSQNGFAVEDIFGKNILEIPDISIELANKISAEDPENINIDEFDGTIGSLYLKFSPMRERYDDLSDEEKTILISIANLYRCGLSENNVYPLDWVKRSAKIEELEAEKYRWDGWKERLIEYEFLSNSPEIKIEEAFLIKIIFPNVPRNEIELFELMFKQFNDNLECLLKIAKKVSDLGNNSENEPFVNARYQKCAINFYSSIIDNNVLEYRDLSNVLTARGIAYTILDEIDDQLNFYNNAITDFQHALVFSSSNADSLEYSLIQYNLGLAYLKIAKIEDSTLNSKEAIQALQNALLCNPSNTTPRQSALTQFNIGKAYLILAIDEEKISNSSNSLRAFQDALILFNEENDIDYVAEVKFCIGLAYLNIAEYEDQVNNYNNARIAFEEALFIGNYGNNSIKYADIQNNLGNVYFNLAKTCENEEQCANASIAIQSFIAASEIYTPEYNPNEYAVLQVNLGHTFIICNNIFDNNNYHDRIDAAYTNAFNTLLFIDQDSQRTLQQLIVNAFLVNGEESNEFILNFLESPDDIIRTTTIEILAHPNFNRTELDGRIQYLYERIFDVNQEVQNNALLALNNYGEQTILYIRGHLAKRGIESWKDRKNATEALARMADLGNIYAEKEFIDIFKDDRIRYPEREIITELLNKNKISQLFVVRLLIAMLKSNNSEARFYAKEKLSSFAKKKMLLKFIIPSLIELLKYPIERVSSNSDEILTLIGEPAKADLEKALQNEFYVDVSRRIKRILHYIEQNEIFKPIFIHGGYVQNRERHTTLPKGWERERQLRNRVIINELIRKGYFKVITRDKK